MRGRRLGLGGLAAALIVATPAGLLPAPLAHATTDGEFGVYVADANTYDGIDGASVQLFSTTTGAAVGAAKTTADGGSAGFTGLSDGGYTVLVKKSGFADEYSRVSFISDDSTSVGQSVYLDPTAAPASAKVKGKVTLNGTVPDYGSVRLYPAATTQAQVDEGDVSYQYAYLRQGGIWGLKVAPASYKIYACAETNDYGCAWLGGANADAATSVSVPANATTTAATINVVTGSTSTTRLDGKVTKAGGVGLSDVRVYLYKSDATESYDYLASTWTNDAGAYGFDYLYDEETEDEVVLPAGNYKLRFEDNRGEFVGEYFNNVALPVDDPATEEVDESYSVPAGATNAVVPATGKVTANAELAKAAVVPATSGMKGKVTNDAGTAIEAYISIVDTQGNYVEELATFRDGTFALPATQLAPGKYKVYADPQVAIGAWNGGAETQSSAPFVTVPVKGVADVPFKLLRYGLVSGTITLPGNAQADLADGYVTLFDLDGDSVEGADAPNGAYTMTSIVPGTYYLRATGYRTSLFDESIYVPYIRQFFSGAYSLATAKVIVVKPGANTKANFTLTNKLTAVSKPTISGKAKVGKTLTGKIGTWNKVTNTVFTYQWKRGSKVVGSGLTYKATKKDKGKKLTFTVTAKDKHGQYVAGASTATSAKIKK